MLFNALVRATALRAPATLARSENRYVVRAGPTARPKATHGRRPHTAGGHTRPEATHGRRPRPKRRKPHRGYRDEASIKGGGDLLSHNKCSTIGAKGLNFSVRYGKRWIPLAITALSLKTSRIREASL